MVTDTLSIGNTIIKLDAIGSTNEYASNLLLTNKGTTEGTVIWAFDQTNGKGQRGALWFSKSGKNLTFSIIMFPDFINIENQFTGCLHLCFSIKTNLLYLFPQDSPLMKLHYYQKK